jgi:hypothetical protein
MKLKLLTFLLVGSGILVSAPITNAYTDKTVNSVSVAGRDFSFELNYDRANAIAGKSLTLTISITTASSGDGFLEILGVPIVEDDGNPNNLVTLTAQGEKDTPRGALLTRDYVYDVKIGAQAEPRRYKTRIDVRYLNGKVEPRFFYLDVGVISKGRLEPAKGQESQEEPVPPSFETGIFKGHEASYDFWLKNSFADYTVLIDKIRIQSEPEGLIKSKDFTFPDPISLAPSEEKSVPLNFDVLPLSVRNMVLGLGRSPTLIIHVTYNDSNERTITDFKHRVKVNVVPSGKVILGAVVFGLLFGVLIRSILEFMLLKKQLTRRGVAKVVTYSIVFGVLLVVLVVAGKIEIKAFAISGSYDNPLAMLIIGLIGAVLGLQLIIGWFKSLKAD